MKKLLVLLIVVTVVSFNTAFAQTADRPKLSVGTIWVYEQDGWQKFYRHTLVKVDDNLLEVQIFGLTEDKVIGERFFTAEWNSLGRGGRRFDTPQPSYNWPLSPGKTWGGKYVDYDVLTRNGTFNITFNLSCKSLDWETVGVPAGKFQSIPVVCRGDYTRSDGYKNYFVEKAWYSPDIGRHAKIEYQDYGSSSGGISTYVLREYRPPKP